MGRGQRKPALYIFLSEGKSIEIVLSPTLLDHWISLTISDPHSSLQVLGRFTCALLGLRDLFFMLP